MANKGNKKCGEIAAKKCAEQVRESVKILCKKCMKKLAFYDSVDPINSYYFCRNCKRSIPIYI